MIIDRLGDMARHRRIVPDGFVHHVINRGDHRETLFHKPADFRAFLALTAEAAFRIPMRILAYCIMRNHFHFVVWPHTGSDLPAYMQLLMNLHIQRYLRHYPPVSRGHLYQGRYTNCLVQSDRHLLLLLRYVEANPVAAGLCTRAEHYKWSSISRHALESGRPAVTEGPVARPNQWSNFVNTPQVSADVTHIQRCARRGAPFGGDAWTQEVAAEHGLVHTIRPRGRPRLYETIGGMDEPSPPA